MKCEIPLKKCCGILTESVMNFILHFKLTSLNCHEMANHITHRKGQQRHSAATKKKMQANVVIPCPW